jgi:hypothetical protein
MAYQRLGGLQLSDTLEVTQKAAVEANLQPQLLSYYVCVSLPRSRAPPPRPAAPQAPWLQGLAHAHGPSRLTALRETVHLSQATRGHAHAPQHLRLGSTAVARWGLSTNLKLCCRTDGLAAGGGAVWKREEMKGRGGGKLGVCSKRFGSKRLDPSACSRCSMFIDVKDPSQASKQ